MNPIASYTFITNLLEATFMDASTNGPIISWLWDFGFQTDGVQETSTLQNPPAITFPEAGLYNVSLTVTSNGGSNQYVSIIQVALTPGLNYTVLELVLAELPQGISINTNNFGQLLRKWQLFYQPAFCISDTNIFDETMWPPLANVLIAKLIIYDFIMKAAQNAITLMGIQTGNTSSTSLPITNTLLAGDFSLNLDFSQLAPNEQNLTVLSLIVNGQTIPGPPGYLNTSAAFLAWINSLGFGVFTYVGTNLLAIANTNSIQAINYKLNTDPVSNVEWAVTNQKVVTQSSQSASGGGTGSVLGPVKTIKTGPSEAAWFDPSIFWSNLFKTGGVIDDLKQDICMYSRRVHVTLPFCPKYKQTVLPIVGKRYWR